MAHCSTKIRRRVGSPYDWSQTGRALDFTLWFGTGLTVLPAPTSLMVVCKKSPEDGAIYRILYRRSLKSTEQSERTFKNTIAALKRTDCTVYWFWFMETNSSRIPSNCLLCLLINNIMHFCFQKNPILFRRLETRFWTLKCCNRYVDLNNIFLSFAFSLFYAFMDNNISLSDRKMHNFNYIPAICMSSSIKLTNEENKLPTKILLCHFFKCSFALFFYFWGSRQTLSKQQMI